MATFDERKNTFEKKFAHDADMQFRAEARANKLLGLWAAGLMNRTGADADSYAQEVIKSDFQEAGDEDVIRKVSGDLGSLASADEIRGKRAEFLDEAKAQLAGEG
ncbi:DUF1476 domain-containing protein [Tropicimonas sp.]|uniref:DUF1476 domain-containing protein n=1 Tax=Tropicimonas sp. TaxID=2067044 RepID=UPI003A8C2AF1